MSNSDDILDSWEEIDEVGLSTQLDQLKKELNSQPDTEMPFHNGVPIMMVMRPDEDYGANYTQPNKPAVKILRRPTQQNASDSKLNDNRPKQPIKTLQQREQEYAEARLRILGSAKNPEDELESSLSSKLVMKSPDISPDNSQAAATYTNAATEANDTATASSLSFLSYNMNIINGQVKSQQDNILRMPRGPDGTPGFNFRR